MFNFFENFGADNSNGVSNNQERTFNPFENFRLN